MTEITQKRLNEFAAQLEVKLIERNLWVASAESCTGGLIAHTLTNIAGSSACVLGGVAAYANEIKMGILGVQAETLRQFGAVSPQTAREMALGVRERFSEALQDAQPVIGLSTTGIAGPGGGTPDKPVGLVYIGLSTTQGTRAYRYVWPHDRIGNKLQSAFQALLLLDQTLETGELPEG